VNKNAINPPRINPVTRAIAPYPEPPKNPKKIKMMIGQTICFFAKVATADLDPPVFKAIIPVIMARLTPLIALIGVKLNTDMKKPVNK
jgi:hypothetical protein